MKKAISLFLIIIFIGNFVSGEDQNPKNSSNKLNIYAGYGTHGLLFGFDYKLKSFMSEKTSTRFFIDITMKNYYFSKKFTFNNVQYKSDTRINAFSLGFSQEFNISKSFHISPYIGVRMESSHFLEDTINKTIGEGKLIRYWNGVVVGKTLNKDYGESQLTYDVGLILNLRIYNKIWLYIKSGYSPITYDSNLSIYGKYWADTNNPNDFAIKQNSLRFEITACYGF